MTIDLELHTELAGMVREDGSRSLALIRLAVGGRHADGIQCVPGALKRPGGEMARLSKTLSAVVASGWVASS